VNDPANGGQYLQLCCCSLVVAVAAVAVAAAVVAALVAAAFSAADCDCCAPCVAAAMMTWPPLKLPLAFCHLLPCFCRLAGLGCFDCFG